MFLALGWLAEWLSTPHFFWNAVRLVPSFSLLAGYDLYYAPDAGPVSGHIYGPIGALAYLPAAITHSPAAAIRIGSLLSTIFYFLPAVWAVHRCWKSGRATRSASLTGILLFGGLTLELDSLRYVAINIHVDSVALGFAMCALVLVPSNIREVHWQDMLPAALCAVLSI
ncbi:MAG TPA: hypothetical protein VK968_04815, partial [Roseimicrobium sp.]|nr:hypothetical protein [Roseimicrobium sp.]